MFLTKPPVELLPCPLCGVDGEQIYEPMVVCEVHALDEDAARGVWAVSCGNCGCVVPSSTTSWRTPNAIERWNDQPVQAKITKLEAEIERLTPDHCLYQMDD